MISRLTAALASCAQLSQLDADKRTWALQVRGGEDMGPAGEGGKE